MKWKIRQIKRLDPFEEVREQFACAGKHIIDNWSTQEGEVKLLESFDGNKDALIGNLVSLLGETFELVPPQKKMALTQRLIVIHLTSGDK